MKKEKYDLTIRTIQEITVHAGTFHSDDVFCVAVAKMLNENSKVHRVNEVEDVTTDIEKGIVVADIGMGPFDHHQKDCPIREDGIKHCGASRVWLVYGYSLVQKCCPELSQESCLWICEKMDGHLLQTIAALDNGEKTFPQNVFSIATIVEGFRPTWDSEKNYDDCFFEAVEMMKQILQNEICSFAGEERARGYVQQCVQSMEQGVVILEKYCPWKEVVIKQPGAKVIVYPSLRGGWNVEPVPVDMEELAYRVTVPDAWRGLRGDPAGEWQEGMTFCHAKGFLIAFDTKEHAIRGAHWLSEQG